MATETLELPFPDDEDPNGRKYREWRATKEGQYVTNLFERFALEALAVNAKFGFRFIAERVRWEVKTTWKIKDFRVNNNHVPYIAREMVDLWPALGALVQFRQRRHRKVPA